MRREDLAPVPSQRVSVRLQSLHIEPLSYPVKSAIATPSIASRRWQRQEAKSRAIARKQRSRLGASPQADFNTPLKQV